MLLLKMGTIDSVKCINHIDDSIDKEAVRLIKLSGNNWQPAVLNGKLVNSRMIIPLTFKHERKDCLLWRKRPLVLQLEKNNIIQEYLFYL